MSKQLIPGSKKSGEFIAVSAAVVIAVTSEALDYLDLPNLDPTTVIIAAVSALVYAALVTLQKVKGVGNEAMAKAAADATNQGLTELAKNSGLKAKVEIETTPVASEEELPVAVESTPVAEEAPVEHVFSDSQEEEPISPNFAPVDKVVL